MSSKAPVAKIPAPAPVVLVIGSGRSGTSLAMQALRRLGARVSDQVVPPSPQNRLGSLEDLSVRDEMTALVQHLDFGLGPRPADWRQALPSRQAEDWLADHLGKVRGPTPYAVKFPAASLFLPIWLDAAERAQVDLRLVWATRQVKAVIDSFGRAYGTSPRVAAARMAQRTFYLLEDAPSKTLLLPYEGWHAASEAQLAALARLAGLPRIEDASDLGDVYLPGEERATRTPSGIRDVAPALRMVDAAIATRRGTIARILGKDKRSPLLEGLKGLLMDNSRIEPKKATRSDSGPGQEPPDDRKADSSRQKAVETTLQAEGKRLREEIVAIRSQRDEAQSEVARLRVERDRLREEAVENTETADRARDAFIQLAGERDRADMERTDLVSRHAVELTRLQERELALLAREQKQRKKLAALSQPKTLPMAEKKALATEKKALATEITRLKAQVTLLRRSARWRMGDAVADAIHRPGRNTLALPYRVMRIWSSRGGTGRKRR